MTLDQFCSTASGTYLSTEEARIFGKLYRAEAANVTNPVWTRTSYEWLDFCQSWQGRVAQEAQRRDQEWARMHQQEVPASDYSQQHQREFYLKPPIHVKWHKKILGGSGA